MASTNQVAVLGLGVNNRPLIPFLLSQGKTVTVYDRRPPEELNQNLRQLGIRERVEVVGGEYYLTHLAKNPAVDTVYVTPGMKKDGPELQALTMKGVHLTCETDLFLSHCPAPVIGITGSAGKTTTTTLVAEALRRDGRHPVFVGGNIGHPLLPEISSIDEDSWVVMELSSFQLDLMERSPHGAAVLNLAPNHLDIHGSYEAYAAAKQKILRFQSSQDWAVVPFHDASVTALWEHFQGRRVFFSLEGDIAHGAYLKDDTLWWRGGNGALPVVRPQEMPLIGRHNVANALAAIAIVASAGGDVAALGEVLRTFRGVPHRLERVREMRDVTFINDSIATAPDRTMAALKAIKTPIVLIAGGYDKGLEYDTLGKELSESTVRLVVALGQTREKIARATRAYSDIPVVMVDTFDRAVEEAYSEAEAGDTVLLSPASASYDMFTNFEQRGQRFREIVGTLIPKTGRLEH